MSQVQYTRATRTVRVKSKNGNYFADVEILMAIALLLPNGFEIAYNVSKVINPIIIDDTGYHLGRPGGQDSTRASHIEIVNGKPDGPAKNQYFAIEICDAFMMVGPNHAEHLISCPSANATPAVVDSVGAGLTQSPPGNTQTRCQHVVKYTQQIPGATSDPVDNPANYAYGLITDCMTFNGPPFGMPFVTESPPGTSSDIPVHSKTSDAIWQDQFGIVFENPDSVLHGALQPDAECHDLTDYTTDPITGEQVPPPPDAGDLNVYVYFPDASGGPFLGDATLPNPPDGNGNVLPTPGYNGIDMGPLWWIRQLGINSNVWYWYVSPVQYPTAWSYFGSPPEAASPKWGYRGWNLLPFFSVAWLLSENYQLVTLGTIGAPDIDTAAGGTFPTGGGAVTVNWYGLGIPDGTFATSTSRTYAGKYLGAGLPFLDFELNDYYMPYGAFDLLGPSSAELKAANAAIYAAAKAAHLTIPDPNSFYEDYGGPTPNIWELTGIEQPPLTDPTKAWDATKNPHQNPTPAVAKQVCQEFVSNWNRVANALNSTQVGFSGTSAVVGWPFVPPLDWGWSKPYGGNTVPTALFFNSGWVPGVLPNTVDPSTVPTIATGQLSAKVWNNAPALAGSPPWKWATGVP